MVCVQSGGVVYLYSKRSRAFIDNDALLVSQIDMLVAVVKKQLSP